MLEAVRTVYRKYADFSGRATRSEYWWFLLFYFLVLIVLAVVASAGRGSSPVAAVAAIGLAVFVLGTLIPSLAVSVRRLHDSDKSGWWLLISLIPYLGSLILLVMMALPSTPGLNRFGPPRGGAVGGQRAQYAGASRADIRRDFEEDAQRAAAAGYRPAWQDWLQTDHGEVLEVYYEYAPDPPWRTPQGDAGTAT